MIEKLEIMMRSIPSGLGHNYEAWSGELTVSLLDVANKVNEIVDHINTKETDGRST